MFDSEPGSSLLERQGIEPLTKETAVRQGGQSPSDRWNAEVRGPAISDVFSLDCNIRVVADKPSEDGCHEIPLSPHAIPKTLHVLIGSVDTEEQRLALVQWTGDIDHGPIIIVVADDLIDGGIPFRLRLLRQDVDDAPWLASAVEDRCRPFEYLETLNIGDVPKSERLVLIFVSEVVLEISARE